MNNKDNSNVKMSVAMKAIKSVKNVMGHELSMDNLKAYRSTQEKMSVMATPILNVVYNAFDIQDLECEWSEPRNNIDERMVVLYCHGGGYITGGLKYSRMLSGKMAVTLGYRVLSFAYRLSPEYMYPAAIDDARAAWDYLIDEGYLSENIIIAGDSAGGNMALELVLRLRNDGRGLPKAIVLFSPWTDMTMKAMAYKKYADADPILSAQYIELARKAYLGDIDDYGSPDYSPVYAELHDMPPTLIQVGSNEILKDDSLLLAKKLKKEKNDVTLQIYRKSWHVFQQMPLPKTAAAMNNIKKFIEYVKGV